MTQASKNIISKIIALLLIFLFSYSGHNQLWDHASFERLLNGSPHISGSTNLLSWMILILELLTVGFLIVPHTKHIGLLLTTLLILLRSFNYYKLLSQNRPCAERAVLSALSWMQFLIFDCLLLLLTLTSFLWTKNNHLFIRINRPSRTPV